MGHKRTSRHHKRKCKYETKCQQLNCEKSEKRSVLRKCSIVSDRVRPFNPHTGHYAEEAKEKKLNLSPVLLCSIVLIVFALFLRFCQPPRVVDSRSATPTKELVVQTDSAVWLLLPSAAICSPVLLLHRPAQHPDTDSMSCGSHLQHLTFDISHLAGVGLTINILHLELSV